MHEPGRPLLEVRNLTKRFGATLVLDRVGFEVRSGEILGLLGPNGAGKTTLMECLAGITPRDAGLVLSHLPVSIFYLPDGITPWEDQSVRWLLGFMAGLHGAAEFRRRELVESLSLGHLTGRAIGALSRGERKRVLLAVGLLTQRPLLLLDEPFEGLDVRQVREVAALLKAQIRLGRTLLVSIHQLTHAERFCDRMILLADGRILDQGTSEELRGRAGVPDGTLEDVFLART